VPPTRSRLKKGGKKDERMGKSTFREKKEDSYSFNKSRGKGGPERSAGKRERKGQKHLHDKMERRRRLTPDA